MKKSTPEKLNISAIICAAGRGERAGLEKNKVLAVMPNGKTVLQNAISAFENCARVSEIVITANESDFDLINSIASELSTPSKVVLGGNTRTQSVMNALKECAGEWVLIHDGARPFITESAVNECIDTLLIHKSAILCAPCTDTVISLNEQNLIESSSRRGKLLAQTPQCFFKEDIIFALNQIKQGEEFTDEAGVYCKYVGNPYPVIGSNENKKLTNPNDFNFESNLRVGTGFDLHTLVEGRKLILGGVEIPHTKGLLGHSDADVLTHAIMDAILSALSLRDIGYHFSDKDARFKDISSMKLLQKVVEMMTEKGYQLNNLSAVIMAEKPKLSPFIESITSSLATALSVPASAIGITCTTTEKIGIIGKEEGVAVQAFCSLKPLK